ncbi:cell envelope integrity protein CreD [bacterium F11]|nr:cell envelope integrity protein CreD [bacterium F11]
MEKDSPVDRLRQWIRTSVTIKFITAGFLILILLIPSAMIRSLIIEREARRNEAIGEISSTWGKSQTLGGPILSVPYRKTEVNQKGKLVSVTKYAHFLPTSLNINSTVDTEVRYRGIYEAILYNTKVNIAGEFPSPDFKEWDIEAKDILWESAYFSIGIPDMRGIKKPIKLNWGKDLIALNPGLQKESQYLSGVSGRIPLKGSGNSAESTSFSLSVDLNGSASLYFVPTGKVTTVSLTSSWKDPSFQGAFLPEKRNIHEKGFEAEWRVLHFNREYPQKWLDAVYDLSLSRFGIDFLIPVDHYRNTQRSTKYAVLFIFLTFVVFFFIEFLGKRRLHPMQYLLVGSAVVLFYLLLLSLSEHMPFVVAYIIAGVGTIGLIGGYTKGVFANKKITMIVTSVMTLLYFFLYCLLQLQDYSLLIGTAGLFSTLAIIMYLTRKINWDTQ